jgi:hypothetical protein
MLRITKIVLTATVAAFGFISGIDDLVNWSTTVGTVGLMAIVIGAWVTGVTRCTRARNTRVPGAVATCGGTLG